MEQTKEEFVRFICDNDLPWRLVKKKSFRRLWFYGTQALGDLPGPDAVKATAERMYVNVQGKLVEMFAEVSSVSLTVDAWTSQNNIPLLGITAHWVDNNWKIRELLLGLRQIKGSHSGSNLVTLVVEVAYHYGIESKICAITTDNASNNKTMIASIVQQLKPVNPQFTIDRHVLCFAHILNLVVQADLKVIRNPEPPTANLLRVRDSRPVTPLDTEDPTDSNVEEEMAAVVAPLGEAVSRVRAIVNAIQGSTQRMEKYVDMCKMFDLPDSNKIKIDCPTRWNSTFKMLERALGKREVLDHLAMRFLSTPNRDYGLCQEDWEMVDEYLCVLGPLCQGTDFVCSTKKLPIIEVTSLVRALNAS
ncbi:putative transcriptional regulator tpeD [Wolffia australiana]